MWIKNLIEYILSPVYPGVDLQEARSVGINRLDNDGILPVYAASESDRQTLDALVEQEGRETNIEIQQLVFIRGDFGRFLQLFGTDPVLLDWDGNNFTIEFNVARWPDWFRVKIINEDLTMPINTPIYYLDANGQAVAAGENNPIPSRRIVSTSAITSVSRSTAYEASRQVKTSAGTLVGLIVHNSKASAQFIQVHDSSSTPADTAIPKEILYVPAQTTVAINILDGVDGDIYANGIFVCNSSTGPTKTIGSSDCWFTVRYR